MNKLIYIALGVIVVTAANVGITRYMMNNQYSLIQTEFETPKFIVVDEGLLSAELKTQPDGAETPPAQLLADRHNLFNALRLQNFIVVSNVNLLTYPASSELSSVNMEQVRAYLQRNDEEVSTASDHEATIKMAEEFLRQQFTLPQ